jgi:HNH endonuclease
MLTAERLRELLHYDPATGVFTWRVTNSNRAPAGHVAGSPNKRGYIAIGIAGKTYYAHRLAWLYMTGSWPEDDVDHRDLDKSNNRWSNLRPATRSQQIANTKARKTNRCGLKGVCERRGRYMATITKNGEQYYIGDFPSPEMAAAAYEAKAKALFGEYARGK